MQLGLIAGNGRFPFLVLEAARAQGHGVTVVALNEETSPDIAQLADRVGADLHWISLGQLGACLGAGAVAGRARPCLGRIRTQVCLRAGAGGQAMRIDFSNRGNVGVTS